MSRHWSERQWRRRNNGLLGKTWNDAKTRCDARIADAKTTLHGTLRAFSGLGAALLEARGDGAPLDGAVAAACGWRALEGLVATAAQLTDTMAADALAHVVHGYHRFRRYAPRMLRMLDLQAAPVAEPLIAAAQLVIGGGGGAVNDLPASRLKMAPPSPGPGTR